MPPLSRPQSPPDPRGHPRARPGLGLGLEPEPGLGAGRPRRAQSAAES